MGGEDTEVADINFAIDVKIAHGPRRAGGGTVIRGQDAEVADVHFVVAVGIAGDRRIQSGVQQVMMDFIRRQGIGKRIARHRLGRMSPRAVLRYRGGDGHR